MKIIFAEFPVDDLDEFSDSENTLLGRVNERKSETNKHKMGNLI